MDKKLWRILILCILTALTLSVTAWAAEADGTAELATRILGSGSCGDQGDNVTWTLVSDGIFTVSGVGNMKDYRSLPDYASRPWSDSAWQISSVVIEDGVTSVGSSAFLDANRLATVSLPQGLISIGANAFRNCTNLTSVSVPPGVTVIGPWAFAGCANLAYITLPDSIFQISRYLFYGCASLENIMIPDSVIQIDDNVFVGCESLRSITIPDDIIEIRESTFNGCGNLKRIAIPFSMMRIGQSAFDGCVNLTDIDYPGSADRWNAIQIQNYNDPLSSAEIHYHKTPAICRVNSIVIQDTGGNILDAIPESECLVTLSVTNLKAIETPLIFLNAYSSSGQYRGLMWVRAKTAPGSTAEVTLPIDNRNGKIGMLKAFAVTSFDDLTPLGNAISFPAA